MGIQSSGFYGSIINRVLMNTAAVMDSLTWLGLGMGQFTEIPGVLTRAWLDPVGSIEG